MEFNDQQLAAIEHDGSHVLVLAGAGTGKTMVIVGRTAHLIRSGVEPGRILLLTFTRRAAREMTARLRLEVGPASDLLIAGTFHHFCLRTMRSMPKSFGTQDSTVIDRDDQIQVMRLVRSLHRKKGEKFPRASEIVRVASYARNTNIPASEYLERFPRWEDDVNERVLHCISGYGERKTASNYIDFDDILFIFASRLHRDEGLRTKLAGLYDHILVDEMQDTNPLQMLILDGLRDPARLFCVGDDAQSIYAFRGADFRNVHSFTEMVPGSSVLKLERNYRSHQEILDLANWLLSESPLEYGRILEARRGKGFKPFLIDFDSDFDEARWIVEDIVERNDRGARLSEHMIIARTAFSTRATEAALIEKKIPYRYVGGTQLFHAAHVKDVVSLIRCVASMMDEIAWMRYLTIWPGIGDRTAALMIDGIREKRGENPAVIFSWLRSSLKRSSNLVDGLEAVASHWNDPPEAMQRACSCLEEVLETRYAGWEGRKRDLELLVRLCSRHRTLGGFLETYALDPMTSSIVERLENDDCVTLITAHSAKGTEARVCYLLKAEPGQYPHFRSLGDEDAEEEERRVLYVAMTRAMDELILTRSLRRIRFPWSLGLGDGPQAFPGSGYFLRDIPPGLVKHDLDGSLGSGEGDDQIIISWRDRE